MKIKDILVKAQGYIYDVLAFYRKYKKAVVAAAGAVVLIAGAVYGETSTEYITIVSILTTLGVRQATNVDPGAKDHDAQTPPPAPAATPPAA